MRINHPILSVCVCVCVLYVWYANEELSNKNTSPTCWNHILYRNIQVHTNTCFTIIRITLDCKVHVLMRTVHSGLCDQTLLSEGNGLSACHECKISHQINKHIVTQHPIN